MDNKNVTERFFGLAGANVSSWCGDKAEFIGRYHGYADPQGVIDGDLKNIASYNENSCGAIYCQIDLQPGETKNIAFLCILYTRAKSLDSHIFTRYTKTYCYGMVIMNYGT